MLTWLLSLTEDNQIKLLIAFLTVLLTGLGFLIKKILFDKKPSTITQPIIGEDDTNTQTEKSSIRVTRLIEPPGSESQPTYTTAWFTATGDEVYYLDSFTVIHHPGMLCSMGSGAQLPDADYSFNFQYAKKTTHPLRPALRIDPSDAKEVSFTLGLAPKGRFGSVGGFVSVTVHYHTSNKRRGTLFLHEANPTGVWLANLLQADIGVVITMSNDAFMQVITPSGEQRGADLHGDTALVYEKLAMPYELFSLYSPKERLTNTPSIEGLSSRKKLNKTIIDKGKLPEILQLVEDDEELGLDLCTALWKDECRSAIEAKLPYYHAITSLAMRHLIFRDDSLASFVLENGAEDWPYNVSELGIALFYAPCGNWEQAMTALAQIDDHVLDLLTFIREEGGGKQHCLRKD